MAFPIKGTPVQTQFALSATSMAVNMPATVDSGDLLIALVEVRTAATWTPPTGWTEFGAQLGGSSVGELTAFYKIADGTEGGGTETFTASFGTSAIWQTIKVTSWDGTTAPEIATSQGDYSTVPNPPNLAPSWGALDTLWIEVAGNTAGTAFTTGASTNYSNYQANTASSGGAQVNISSADRELNAASEDAGAFANATNIRYWAAMIIAIRPAAAAGGWDFEIADESSASSIDNIAITQAGGTLAIADENSASSIDNIVLEYEGGTFEIADESSASSIDNIVLQFQGNFQVADELSASSIDNITLARNGGDFVIEDAVSSSSIENVSIAQSGSLLISDIETTSSIDNITLESGGGTLSVADISSTSEADNIQLIGNLIIGDIECEAVVEAIKLEFVGATFVIADISSTSEINNIPLIGEFIIQDINAPPTIENITLESGGGDFIIEGLTSSSSIGNITIGQDIPENLKTIFIVNRGKVAKWINGNNYIEL